MMGTKVPDGGGGLVQTTVFKIYHDQMDRYHRTGNNKTFVENSEQYFCPSWLVLGIAILASHKSRQAKERPELFWPSFYIPQVLTAKCLLLRVSNDE